MFKMAWDLPTTALNGTSGLMTGLATWSYSVTGGWFFVMLLFGFCVVLYIAASRYTSERAFGYATTTGMLGAIPLLTLNLMSWWMASIFILLGVIGIIWMIIKRD